VRPAKLSFALVGTFKVKWDSGRCRGFPRMPRRATETSTSAPRGQSKSYRRQGGSHQCPEPALFFRWSDSRFRSLVDHRLMGQLPLQFRAGFGDSFTGLFPRVLNTARTERYAQNLSQQLPAPRAWHPADHGQISDQRPSLRSEMAMHFLRQFRLRGFSAVRTDSVLATVLRDMRWMGGSSVTDVAPVSPCVETFRLCHRPVGRRSDGNGRATKSDYLNPRVLPAPKAPPMP